MSISNTCTDAMKEAEGYNAWVVDQFRTWLGERIVEVGLGHGGFFKHLPKGKRYWGVDIDPDVISHCRKMCPENDYRVLDITTEDFSAFCRGSKIDTILCFNVIEHIEDDRLAVRRMLEGLDSGGMLHLFVPAHALIYNDMDRLAGHFRRYDRARLKSVLPDRGIDLVRLEYFNPVGALGWLLNRLIRHDSLNSARIDSQIRFYERYLLPVSKFMNPVSRRLFGQSVLAIIRRAS